jgi:hypothetical protein
MKKRKSKKLNSDKETTLTKVASEDIVGGFYDLSDEEIEELRDAIGIKYPDKNKFDEKLFDANGNIPLSTEER